MADTIVQGTQFNAQNIKYSAPKALASGGKSVNILNKQTNSGLRIATPLMLTWGASDFEGNQKFEFALQFPSDDYKNEETSEFLKNMMAFENKIKADALVYSKEWFGKLHKSADVVEALWTPMLKYSKNKQTGDYDLTKSPTIRVKMPQWEGVWRCEIYDEEGGKLFPDIHNPLTTPVDFIQKATNVACLLQCGGLWFANGKFGLTWKLVQAVAQKSKTALTGQCFIKLKTSDKEKIKQTVASSEVEEQDQYEEEPVQKAKASTLVEDTDDEAEAAPVQKIAAVQVAEHVAQEEEKVVVKKKIVKKKVAESNA